VKQPTHTSTLASRTLLPYNPKLAKEFVCHRTTAILKDWK